MGRGDGTIKPTSICLIHFHSGAHELDDAVATPDEATVASTPRSSATRPLRPRVSPSGVISMAPSETRRTPPPSYSRGRRTDSSTTSMCTSRRAMRDAPRPPPQPEPPGPVLQPTLEWRAASEPYVWSSVSPQSVAVLSTGGAEQW